MKKLNLLDKIHWIVITLSLILTFVAWKIAKEQVELKESSEFLRASKLVEERILERMREYEGSLKATVAAYHALDKNYDAMSWRRLAKSLDIAKLYPGVNGIGVIYKIKKEDENFFIKNQQKLRPYFKIHPKHNESELWPITFIEPEKKNFKAIGLDMAHEKNRYHAAKLAKESKKPQITGPIILVQDERRTPGFLFFYPFYREDQFKGLVYAPFILNNLIKGTLSKKSRSIKINIQDDNTTIYDEGYEKEVKDRERSSTFDLYGRRWTLSSWNTKKVNEKIITGPNIILVAGLFIDILLFMLFISINKTKIKAQSLASDLTEDLNQKIHELQLEMKEKKLAKKESLRSARLATVGELSAGMAHEINNPLAIITGYLAIIKKNLKKENYIKVYENLQKVEDASARISKIIESLRKFSRDDSAASLEKVKVSSLIRNCTDLLGVKFAKYEIDLKIEIEDLEVYINESEVIQVMYNLISNSAQAIEELKNRWIKITTEDAGSLVHINVTDSGKGINESVSEKIFDPFFTTKDPDKGTGLGLSISKTIIEKNGGDLRLLENTENTTFSITLPKAN